MVASIIETREITKAFGDLVAVDALSLTVHRGEVFGLLGQNGSGKTTLIRMLNTLLPITRGQGFVCGVDVQQQPRDVRRLIGVVPQALTSDTELTAQENMDLYARFYEVPRRERRRRIDELFDRVELSEFRHKLVGRFSGGMRRRLEIARGMIHRPRLLILDEPTIGLDPNSRRRVWTLLREFMADHDLTVLLTTHYLDEAESLCGRVGIIERGRLRALDTPERLCASLPGSQRIEVRLSGQVEPIAAALRALPQVDTIDRRDGGVLELAVREAAAVLTRIIDLCHAHGAEVQSVSMRRLSLEDAFIHYVGHELRDEAGDFRPAPAEIIY